MSKVTPKVFETPTPASTLPTIDQFPDASIVGGAVLLDGKNMGVLLVTGEVEVSSDGAAYLAGAGTPAALASVQTLTEAPDPIPLGVLDPADHTTVQTKAKQAVRKRKQNEAVVEAMNSPTAEEEAAFAEADAAAVAPPEPPPAP